MARFIFRLPDVGEGVAEAEITVWHVAEGDRIEEDQSLVDVMTDKATVDIESPVAGTVSKLHGEVGALVPVGSPLVEIEIEGELSGHLEELQAEESPAKTEPAPEPAPNSTPKPPPTDSRESRIIPSEVEGRPKPAAQPAPASQKPAFATRAEGEGPLAAPATRRRAHELGIPLQYVPGTGPGGRITPDDLDAYIARGDQAPTGTHSGMGLAPRTGIAEQKIVGLRRKIAEKMQDSKRRIPHFTYVEEFDMTALEALRRDLNSDRAEGQPKLTLLPFFMRAMVRLLPEFPHVNARYDDDAGVLHKYEGVHLGIATQTPNGLIVPVVRHAEALDIWDAARELSRVTAAARDGSATREELSGSTITLTSLGTLGGISATPVINHPEVAIVGPNKLVERPVVIDGRIEVRTVMNVSSSFDHRIVDGYDAAQFIQRLKRLIESPARIFMDPA